MMLMKLLLQTKWREKRIVMDYKVVLMFKSDRESEREQRPAAL